MSNPLDQVPEVLIDSDGVFKYILINVCLERDLDGNEACKVIVRGNKRGEYHGRLFKLFKNFNSVINFSLKPNYIL